MKGVETWPVIDLFSGSGGMSCGFHRRAPFEMIAAVDYEVYKPSQKNGALDCNQTYLANIGIAPLNTDIGQLSPRAFFSSLSEQGKLKDRGDLTVLLCCPPCTDFSRVKPENHLTDSKKNSLVVKCADFVEELFPEFVVMENARELISGNNPHHYRKFVRRLNALGYDVRGEVLMLTDYGLPQIRERAIVVASRIGPAKTLDQLWEGWTVLPAAVTVKHAIGRFSRRRIRAGELNSTDPMHQCPGFGSALVFDRMKAIPKNGGSWFDLARSEKLQHLLIPSMKERVQRGDFGSHPDVYGRLSWAKPSVTIKRECAHVGNGRYAHPEQDRLLTVREMAMLQGFPDDFTFSSKSLAHRYRHIGDAVPPMIAYQLSALVQWMKTGVKPSPEDWILPGTSLTVEDMRVAEAEEHEALVRKTRIAVT
jgi:DNA (cytosine-5)-methyltransferase 1